MDTKPFDKLNAKNSMAETISQLAHRHLKDPNHTTSDEELRYAKVELTGYLEPDRENLFEIDNTPIFPPFEGEANRFSGDEKITREKSSAPPNPYNIIS
jgi:hypothetical protein